MDGEQDTEELRAQQRAREVDEQERAQSAHEDDEEAQHQRRADKARYLREKLDERADSERKRRD